MMAAEQIATDKARLVIGLGETGWSVARHFKRLGYPFMLADTRENPPYGRDIKESMPDVALSTGEIPKEWVAACDELILSPGVDPRSDFVVHAKELGKAVIGDMELFRRLTSKPIIAISGSNAKSTVVELLGHIAKGIGVKAAIGGNLGTPVLDLLSENVDTYVLEASSFQLELAEQLDADPACLLNVTPDHLDRYQDFESYYRAKHRIFRSCRSVVFNRDDKLTRPLFGPKGKVIRFGMGAPDLGDYGLLFKGDRLYLAKGGRFLMPTDLLFLRGKQNYANILAALAVADAAGWIPENPQTICELLRDFKGLAHRCEWIGNYGGVDYINDSKATNPEATCAALTGLAPEYTKTHVILGGSHKKSDFTSLAQTLANTGSVAYLIGEEAQCIKQSLHSTTEYIECKDLPDALRKIQDHALKGDLALLSPACASFDEYKNYAERGEHFRELVCQG